MQRSGGTQVSVPASMSPCQLHSLESVCAESSSSSALLFHVEDELDEDNRPVIRHCVLCADCLRALASVEYIVDAVDDDVEAVRLLFLSSGSSYDKNAARRRLLSVVDVEHVFFS